MSASAAANPERLVPSPGARLALCVLSMASLVWLPLPSDARLPAWGLPILAVALVVVRKALPTWVAATLAGGAAWASGLPEAPLGRVETWGVGASFVLGALLLSPRCPPVPIFFLNVGMLAFSAFSPAGSPPALALAVIMLIWVGALEAACLPAGVPYQLRASLLSMLRLVIPVGGMVLFFTLLLPKRDEMESVSGFSGTGILEAGAFGRVRLSPEPAFRAHFESEPPLRVLYWRGDVLEENGGFTWRRARPMPPGSPPQPSVEILDPTLNRAPVLEHQPWQPGREDSAWLAQLLHVPKPVAADPAVREFVGGLDASSTPAALASLRKKLASGGYVYSLRPGRIGRLQVGRFLAETRAGFCEHYAAAAANVLRVAGVPARIVAGFRGGSWNPWNQTLTVRALHAHAWVEAWDPAQKRWLRFDPTDAVTHELSLRDATEWNVGEWPVWEKLARRFEAWAEDAPILAYGLLAAFGAATLLALPTAVWLAGRATGDPAARLLARMEQRARRLRAPLRAPGETPLAWMHRIARAHPREAARWAEAAQAFERLAYMPPEKKPRAARA